MSDVARLAGVGVMTVSRVLNNSANVSEDATQRVQTAIAQLNYRPNEMARALRGQRSRTIGLILPYLYDPFFAMCAHAVTTAAQENGYSVTMTTSNEDPEIEYREAMKMLHRHVEGLILIPANLGRSRLNQSVLGKVPLVAFDRPLTDPVYDTVMVENESGARRMVEHLIEHGHTEIAFMGLSRSLFTINARYQGYERAILEAGLKVDAFFECDTPESTYRGVDERLRASHPPTAFFTSNTLATRYVFTSLVQMNVHIPTGAALAGFDDFDLSEMLSPPVTVVRQPVQQLGRVAARQLFERLEAGEAPQAGNHIVLPVELVLRRSCGCKNKTALVLQ